MQCQYGFELAIATIGRCLGPELMVLCVNPSLSGSRGNYRHPSSSDSKGMCTGQECPSADSQAREGGWTCLPWSTSSRGTTRDSCCTQQRALGRLASDCPSETPCQHERKLKPSSHCPLDHKGRAEEQASWPCRAQSRLVSSLMQTSTQHSTAS
jgi:hypothetical protein